MCSVFTRTPSKRPMLESCSAAARASYVSSANRNADGGHSLVPKEPTPPHLSVQGHFSFLWSCVFYIDGLCILLKFPLLSPEDSLLFHPIQYGSQRGHSSLVPTAKIKRSSERLHSISCSTYNKGRPQLHVMVNDWIKSRQMD